MSHRSSLTILLIDDCTQDRVRFCRFLQQDSLYTYRILGFKTATAAVKWCQQEIPDVILLDCVLRDGHGLEYLQQFREHLGNTQSAIIMLTEKGDALTGIRAMKSGAQDYLVKDKLTAEILQSTIHSAVEQMHLIRQLEQSRAQQQLIGAIARRICQCVKLEENLRVTTEEVRQLLKADWVVVYQLQPDMSGTIVAESVVLGKKMALGTLSQDSSSQQGGGSDYTKGRKGGIDHIEPAGLTGCQVRPLEKLQVKGNLVAPILVKNRLWGVFIAHQCSPSHQWQSVELDFLEQVAVQISLAIQQVNADERVQVELAERQRAKAALRDSEEKLKLTLNFAHIGYWEWNPITNELFGSENALRCLGCEPSRVNVTYEEWASQIHPEDRQWVERELRVAMVSQTELDVDYRLIWDDGSIHWLSAKGRGVYDENGQPQRMLGVVMDISARKQAEAALRESEERLRLALMAANQGLYDLNLQTGEAIVNPEYATMLGYEPAEFRETNAKWIERLHPEDRENAASIYRAYVAGEIPEYKVEFRQRTQNGGWKWILSLGKIVAWDTNGQPLRMLGTHTDISDRKQAEEERQRVEKLQLELQILEHILETTLAGYWDWDIPGNREYLSPTFKRMFGYEDWELPNTPETWQSLIFPEDLERVFECFDQHIKSRGQIPYYNEVRYRHKDGSTIWVICSGHVIEWDRDGNPLRMVGCHFDLTERKQAEEELRKSEHRYATLAEALPVSIFRFDTAGHCVYVNDRWCEMMGRPVEEALGMGWVQTIHPEDCERIVMEWSQWSQAVKERRLYQNEGRCLRPDGSIIWFYCQILPETDLNGNAIGYVGVLMDISDRKQAEAQLQQTNEQLANANMELARATRLKDEFLANMSHELRTPLNAILGMSEGFQEGVFGSINERQTKAIGIIERSGRHLLELINDILDLSKIESGKLELQIGDVSVSRLCDISLTFIKQMALKKNIHLSTLTCDNLGSIQVDELRLRQLLINLLTNAVKFTPEGGSVALEVWPEKAEEQKSTDICFSVTDTGIGIAPQDISKLFQPFVQLDSDLNRQYNGTGLGLALVRQIASLHGGTVSVKSEIGQGSCFTVRIPYRTSDNSPILRVATSLPNYSLTAENAQVLIIEDSVPAADQITRYLSELGLQHVVYPRGEGAVEEVLRVQPALIVLDLQLPNLSGWDVLAQLKANSQTKEIPVIIVSVMDERSKGLAHGAFDYLVKPITRADFQATLEKLQHPQGSDSAGMIIITEPKPEAPLILLAEDNQANIDTMSSYLETRGYRLLVAKNGQQAIELAKSQRPDLIVMDIQMPEMDGLEAMRCIRKEQQCLGVPIIALTALAMPNDRETCLAAGANEYLSKPVKLKQLAVTIQQLLRS
ncbi:hypothetical protein NUACC21_15890 [Scytonema sp. NUACC21]